MINYITVALDQLVDGPWRLTEKPEDNQKLRPSRQRQEFRAQENIAKSLQKVGQLSPIHIRPVEITSKYQILNGHVVVAAARQVGLQSLVAILHLGLTDGEAHMRYLHFNFNHCEQFHGKFLRDLKKLYDTNGADERAEAAAELRELTPWDLKSIAHYILVNEHSKTWRQFKFSKMLQEESGTSVLEDDESGNA
jgi:hypothetical protein